jgi:hypothetical protein
MDNLIFIVGIVIIIVAYLYSNKYKHGNSTLKNQEQIKQLEVIIEKHFLDLLEENNKLHQSYIQDINHLQKKIRTIERKLQLLEQYKQFDIKVDNSKDELNAEIMQLDISKQDTSKQDVNKQDIESKDIESQDINDEIIKLYKQGYSIEEISKQLNLMCGEVQLIIGISKSSNE